MHARACPRRIKCKPIAKRFETCVETNKTRESFDNTWNIPKISIRCGQICFNLRRVFLYSILLSLFFFSSNRTTPIADQYLTSKFHLLRIAENSLSRRDFSSVCCIETHLPAPFFFPLSEELVFERSILVPGTSRRYAVNVAIPWNVVP